MSDDLLKVLTRFHREVVVPDIDRLVDERISKTDKKFDEILTHFDAIYQRFDRLDLTRRREGREEVPIDGPASASLSVIGSPLPVSCRAESRTTDN
jgi:hypothetical protein